MGVETVRAADIESEVLRSSIPVIVDFYQASCPPCRALEPRLERVADQYRGRVKVYRVDLEVDMPAAEHFRVTSVPTVIVLRDAQEVDRLDRLITTEQLQTTFERASGAAA
jgi:thioredoxin 1